MQNGRVAVIGAGIGGLVAALELAANGLDVTIIERAATAGGKMRQVSAGNAAIDAGPTVFTMRWVFEELFAAVGAVFEDHVATTKLSVLARHAWPDGSRLDLFADQAASTAAISAFSGESEARRFDEFRARASRIYQSLEEAFIKSPKSGPLGLVKAAGLKGLGGLWQGAPFSTLWRELGIYFHDPRLRQLFGRYATYCGSSPFQSPAMLMLVAHVESVGVWSIDGGMYRLAQILVDLATQRGARFRYGTEAVEIAGNAKSVTLSTGERLDVDAVIVNADAAALGDGVFGRAVAVAVETIPVNRRSLSALTWVVSGKTDGFPLHRHNVFFSDDYAAEFADIFERSRLPRNPTIYVCAQDRDDSGASAGETERLLCLINAPPVGDRHEFDKTEVEACAAGMLRHLARCGLSLSPEAMVATTPSDFHRLFPATGGALYGEASHGWQASFRRPGSRTKIPCLYLAGGSTHPGPGVPMAALSGRLAAQALLRDLASTRSSMQVAMSGGISTRSATIAGTG